MRYIVVKGAPRCRRMRCAVTVPCLSWGNAPSSRRSESFKGAPYWRREALQRHAFEQVCFLPLLLPLLLLPLLLLFLIFFVGVRIVRTRVPLFCKSGQNDVLWSLWDIKRRRLTFYLFFLRHPKMTLFRTASVQNDVVLGCPQDLKKIL